MSDRSRRILKIATILVMVAVLLTALYIMAHGLGLQKDLDFGAGSYYYADIPEFERYLGWDAFTARVPYWVHVVLFLVWGGLFYFVWKKLDR